MCEKIGQRSGLVWEPACGQGHMSEVLKEYFPTVHSSDKYDYDYGDAVGDFLVSDEVIPPSPPEWIITNPPFNQAEQFITRGLEIATVGVAMIVRTTFLEGVGRYTRLFKNTPPLYVYQFVERVPMQKGKLVRDGSTATAYCWVVFKKGSTAPTRLVWIEPCRKALERDADYKDEVGVE